jgi:hypothetical protein
MTDESRVGDTDHLPTLDDIIGRLPDGGYYDDGLEARGGGYLGGWIDYQRESCDAATGRWTGVLEVSTDAPALVEAAAMTETYPRGTTTVVLRRFRVEITEIPREPATTRG